MWSMDRDRSRVLQHWYIDYILVIMCSSTPAMPANEDCDPFVRSLLKVSTYSVPSPVMHLYDYSLLLGTCEDRNVTCVLVDADRKIKESTSRRTHIIMWYTKSRLINTDLKCT